MKLLILTQAIDINNPVMGFFAHWVEEFSKKCEKITVICLEKGEYSLPGNVKVLSLGKEGGVSRLKYIYNFYKYIWNERKNYDAVFVHMNQEYVLLGWKLWKVLGKKIMLWRNHPYGSCLTKFAVWVSDRVFCTSPFSYTAKFKKTEIMPVGIDTDFFRRKLEIKKIPNSILFLSRISPIKNPALLVEALNLLNNDGVDFNVLIVGDPLPGDVRYYENIKSKVKGYGLADRVNFIGSIKHEEAVDLYNKYEIYVNLTPTGSMDKTIFEAMACESLVVVCNKSLSGKISNNYISEKEDCNDVFLKLKSILLANKTNYIKEGLRLRNFVIKNHSLKKLVINLFDNSEDEKI